MAEDGSAGLGARRVRVELEDPLGRAAHAAGLERAEEDLVAVAEALADLERRRSGQLLALASVALELTEIADVDVLLQVVTDAACDIIGTHQGVTSRLSHGWTDASTFVRLSDKYAAWRDYDEVPKGLGVLNAVTRENKPLRLTGDELVAHPEWRGLRDSPGHPPLPDYLAAPLVARDGNNLGLIQLADKLDGLPFSAADEAILVQLAQMASAAIQNIEFVERERAGRSAAERSAQVRGFLAEASRSFAASLRIDETLATLVGLVVPGLADWCCVHLVAEDHERPMRLAALTHRDPDEEQPLRSFLEAFPVTVDQPVGPGAAIATGTSQLLPTVTDEVLSALTDDPSVLERMRSLTVRSAVVVPLIPPTGAAIGAVTMSCTGDVPLTADEMRLLEDLAGRAALALENARLYTREREAAATLQRSMLPQALPRTAGLHAAARYFPGSAGAAVGGDWYDVLDLGDGRLAIVVGDVMGRGVPAAAVMGQLRAAVRTVLLAGEGPARTLELVDRFVCAFDELQLTTCLVGIIDGAAGRFTVAAAGHPPPLLTTVDGPPRYLVVEPGVPLGIGGIAFTEQVEVLPPGATLLLYTDGLVEAPGESIDDGMARVAAAAAGTFGSPAELCDAILEALGQRVHSDDTALLAVTLAEAVSEPSGEHPIVAIA
ncbi:MAG: GAF domain-containing SpoIIE family protein phosphatase [Acidimicrobiales bacterium]